MIIMIDLDDTILNSKGEITPYTLEVLTSLPKDYKLVFNSARSLKASQAIAKQLHPDYQILNAGSTIYDFNNNLIYANPITVTEAQAIIKTLKANNIFNILVEAGDGFLSDNLNFIASHNYVSYANFDSFSKEAYKIVYHADNARIGQEIAKKYHFDFTTYVNSNIHKISKTCKGDGVKTFRKLFAPKETIMAFGDDTGDISMLLEADIPVKMANSHPTLAKYNFFTCLSNDEDGVAKYISAYIKKKEGI